MMSYPDSRQRALFIRHCWSALVVLVVSVPVVVLVSGTGSDCHAQLFEEQKAVVAFDLQMTSLKSSRVGSAEDVRSMAGFLLSELTDEPLFTSGKVNRVFGAASNPASLVSLIDFLQREESSMVLVEGGIDIRNANPPSNEFDWPMPEEPEPEPVANEETEEEPEPESSREIVRLIQDEKPIPVPAPDLDPNIGTGRTAAGGTSQKQDELNVDPLPIDFFVQFVFDDRASADEMFNHYTNSRFTESETIADVDLYMEKNSDSSLRMRMYNETTIEFGSRVYLIQPTRQFFTDRLLYEWSKFEGASLRIAFDLEAGRQFVHQIKLLAGEENLEKHRWLERTVDKSSALRATADLSNTNTMELIATVDNPVALTQVTDGLNRLLKTVREFLAADGLDGFKLSAPGSSKLATALLAPATVQTSANEITLVVPKIANFDETLIQFAAADSSWESFIQIARWDNEIAGMEAIFSLVQKYETAHEQLPFTPGENQSADMSWRARVVDHDLDYSRPWNDPNGNIYTSAMTHLIFVPDDSSPDSATTDICRLVTGSTPLTSKEVSNEDAIMLMQIPDAVHWAQNTDISVEQALEYFRQLGDDEALIVATYDGQCIAITRKTSEEEFLSRLQWDR